MKPLKIVKDYILNCIQYIVRFHKILEEKWNEKVYWVGTIQLSKISYI